jgi:hypothetical protein
MIRVRSVLLRGGAVVAALLLLGLLWLVMARRLAELVDSVATVRVANLSPTSFGWNGTWLQFGPAIGKVNESLVGQMPGIDRQFRSLDLTGPGPLYGAAAEITVDAEGRLKLSAGGKSFMLGTRSEGRVAVDAAELDLPQYAAEPGDSASLVIKRGLAWPTPFEMNVVGLGGTATTWRRHVYYRLSWVKASGARLSMLWEGEQPYDGVNLWRAPGSFLIKVDIH